MCVGLSDFVFQKELFLMYKCGDEFNLQLRLSDLDISVLHQIVVKASIYPELAAFLIEIIAYVTAVLDGRQRDCFDFKGYSFIDMADAVFTDPGTSGDGSANTPITVADGGEVV